MRILSRCVSLLAAAILVPAGCGKPDDAELAARSREVNTPNGPMILGFWPAEPRKFALEKAKALTSEPLPADSETARVVRLSKVEVAKLPAVVELTFYQNKLLTVYAAFLTRDTAALRRVRELLDSTYGQPGFTKPGNADFAQWLVKKPLPFTVVTDAPSGRLPFVASWDTGPLFQSALPTTTEFQAEDDRRVLELAKKSGF